VQLVGVGGGAQQLDGHAAAELPVVALGEVDDAHPAAPQLAQHAVRADAALREHLGDLGLLHPAEEAVLHHLALPRLQLRERPVQRQDVVHRQVQHAVAVGEGGLLPAAAPLLAVASPRAVDQHLAHGAGGDGQEVRPVRGGDPAAADQLQVGFVDQTGGLEGGRGSMAAELPAREPPQLVVDDRKQAVYRGPVSRAHGAEDPRHVVGLDTDACGHGLLREDPWGTPVADARGRGLAAPL
jgi:hypothetical protein